jgi:choline dehydrogenase-like flavoprotein
MLYAGHFPRLHPSDFRVKSLDGVADDWPIDYATLEPFYAENDRMMGVSGLAGDPAYPPQDAADAADAAGQDRRDASAGDEQLGWHWWPSDSAIATPNMKAARAASTSATARRAARRAPRPAPTSPTGRMRSAPASSCAPAPRARDHDRRGRHGDRRDLLRRRRQGACSSRPIVVIVACNGIGTPRLLLNSHRSVPRTASPIRAASSGKNLMFHPYAQIRGYSTSRSTAARAGNCMWSQEFYETDPSRGFVRGYTLQFSRRGPVVTAIGHGRRPHPLGRGAPSTRTAAALQPQRRHGRRSARTCPRSTTGHARSAC